MTGSSTTSWAPRGGLGTSGPARQLAWVARTGEASAVDSAWTFFRGGNVNQGWSLSPDGSRVALREFSDGGYDIWIKRLDTGPRSRLTFDDSEEKMPVWEPGGENVTYLSNRNGNFDVWSKRADGIGEPELLLDLEVDLFKIDWSPDGEWLLLQTAPGDVLGYRPGENAEPIPLLAEAYGEREPAVSRDGRWLAYVSNETGRNEIYVRPFPDVNAGRWQVSSQTGRNPRWAHSGRELYFVEDRAEGAMWVVGVQSAASFAFEAPVLLFASPGQWSGDAVTGNTYDVAPDDQRFLIGRIWTGATGGADDGVAGAPTVLVNNFFEELERLVPN